MFSKVVADKLSLQLLMQSDAEELFNLIDQNRSYLQQWMVWPPATKSADDTNKFIKACLIGLAENTEMACGIKYHGQLIGVITYNVIDTQLKKVIIGYWISAEYQGRGIVTKSCRCLIDYAFTTLAMQKIEIRTASENLASQKICERLGFKLEGSIRNSENLHGNIVSHHIYGLMVNEYHKKQPL
ncbi:MAG: hypothetical protein OFPII_20240 [Osedax symbiont Rs1]|nr:MAG: hypothetical protein OFPII_20240 [Osedax symbiont Rs1]